MTTTAHPDSGSSGEDLATEILRRRRKRLPAVTAVLALAVVAAAGVIGGIEIQKHWGSSPSSNGSSGAAAAFASRFGSGGAGRAGGRSGSGGFGAFPGGGFGGDAAVGTVTLIKGSSLYVTEADGNTVLVHTSAGSQVTKTVQGTVKTVHPGDTVTVTGAQASDGSYTASRISIAGAGSNG